MSAGHGHADELAASKLADDYHDRVAALVAAAAIVDNFDVPWLANRSFDGARVYRDRRLPRLLPITGVDTSLTLPWHELGELVAMNDGLSYDDAHNKVATPLERRALEEAYSDQPDIWRDYSDELDDYEGETVAEFTTVPPDMDLRPFAQDDPALLQEIVAAQDGNSWARGLFAMLSDCAARRLPIGWNLVRRSQTWRRRRIGFP